MEDSIEVIVGIFLPTKPRRARRIAGVFVNCMSLIGLIIVGLVIAAICKPEFSRVLDRLLLP
jgi:hypothetical protein